MTVTAVFTDEPVKDSVAVILETSIKEQLDSAYKAEFMVTRYIPKDYVLVSSGLFFINLFVYDYYHYACKWYIYCLSNRE